MREAQPHLGLAAQSGVCEKTGPSRGQSWCLSEAGLPGRVGGGAILGGYGGNIRVALGFPETEGAKLEGLGAAAPSLLVAGLSLGLQLPAWSGDSLVPGWTLGPADMGCWKVCFLTCPQGQQGKVAELSSHESRGQGCRLALPRLALSGCLRNLSVH